MHSLRPAKTFELPLQEAQGACLALLSGRRAQQQWLSQKEEGGGVQNQNSSKMKLLGKTQSSPPTSSGFNALAFERGDQQPLSGCDGKVGCQLLALTRRQLTQVQSILKKAREES